MICIYRFYTKVPKYSCYPIIADPLIAKVSDWPLPKGAGNYRVTTVCSRVKHKFTANRKSEISIVRCIRIVKSPIHSGTLTVFCRSKRFNFIMSTFHFYFQKDVDPVDFIFPGKVSHSNCYMNQNHKFKNIQQKCRFYAYFSLIRCPAEKTTSSFTYLIFDRRKK